MAELNDWAILAANNNNAPPDGWPENTMQYSEVNNTAREGMAVMARYYQDINGSVHVGGIVNVYTVTLNSGHAAYFDGLYMVLHWGATNTGPSTIDVNGIGPVAIQDRNGNVLASGALQLNGIYELRYDGTQFQLMGTVSGAVNATQGIFSTNTAIDLIDADNALNVGAADPLLGQHLAFDLRTIQSKFNGNLASSIFINPLGGATNIGRTTGATQEAVTLYSGGFLGAALQASGFFNLYNSALNDLSANTLRFMWQSGNIRQTIGATSGGEFRFDNLVNGVGIRLDANDTGGTSRQLLVGDPDGPVDLYNVGVKRFATGGSGTIEIYSDGNTDAEDRNISLVHQNGTLRATIGHIGNQLVLRNRINSGAVSVDAQNAGGSIVNCLVGSPDGNTTLYRAGVINFATSGSGTSTQYSVGNTDTETRYFRLAYQNGTLRGFMGHNGNSTLAIDNRINAGFITLVARDTGGVSRNGVTCDPNGPTSLYETGVRTAGTLTGALGGLEVRNDLTGGGFERVLTESDNATAIAAYQGITSQAITTTTLTDITNLTFTLPDATSIWDFELMVPLQVSATIGTVIARLRQVSGAGFLASTGIIRVYNTLTDSIDDLTWGLFTNSTITLNPSSAGGIHPFTIRGTIKADGGGSPPLTYQLQIARGTSGNVTVGGQSWIKLTRIG